MDALPEVKWDMVIMESKEELVSGDGRESQFDVTEEYDGRVVTVGAFMLVGDVGEEGVNGIEGLTVWLARTLRGCEETGLEGVMEEGVTQASLIYHEEGAATRTTLSYKCSNRPVVIPNR